MLTVNKVNKSKKRVQKILGIFTETLEQLGKEKERLRSVIAENDDLILQARTQNGEATSEITKIEGVIGNISKIVEV